MLSVLFYFTFHQQTPNELTHCLCQLLWLNGMQPFVPEKQQVQLFFFFVLGLLFV